MRFWGYRTSMLRVLIIALLCLAPLTAQASDRLETIHQSIVEDYPTLGHISREDVAKLMKTEPTHVLILDTRPQKEFTVSHIAGAHQVDPKISTKDFLTRFAPLAKDKTVIVYCSVGRRSSHLGVRLQEAILDAGATHVLNMEGGLFGWHNDERSLIGANGPTEFIHPYNFIWQQRLKNKHLARYTP